MKSIQKYVAEFIGTGVLVTLACGTAVILGCPKHPIGYALTALAFGLVIVAMAYSIGNISGCHINPAVSLAMLISKRMTVKDFIGYVIAQFLGGIAGAGILGMFLKSNANLGANGFLVGGAWRAFGVEVALTFVFVLTILGVTSKAENASVAGLVIGLTLTLVHIFGIAFTGTSVNPARSFGPALLQGGAALSNVWVFILAPLVGGVIAALVYMFLTYGKDEEK